MSVQNTVDTSFAGGYLSIWNGAPETLQLTLGGVVDRILRNSANAETLVVDFLVGHVRVFTANAESGVDQAELDALLTALNATGTPREMWEVPPEYEGKRSVQWSVLNRARPLANTGGVSGMSDVLDPKLPSATLPSLINRLEDGGSAQNLLITQLNPVPGRLSNGWVAEFTATELQTAIELDISNHATVPWFSVPRVAAPVATDLQFE